MAAEKSTMSGWFVSSTWTSTVWDSKPPKATPTPEIDSFNTEQVQRVIEGNLTKRFQVAKMHFKRKRMIVFQSLFQKQGYSSRGMLMGLGVSFIIFFLSFFIFFYFLLIFFYFFIFFIFFYFWVSHWHSTPLWNIMFFYFLLVLGSPWVTNWHSIPLLKDTMGHNWHSIPLWNILWVTTGTLMKISPRVTTTGISTPLWHIMACWFGVF